MLVPVHEVHCPFLSYMMGWCADRSIVFFQWTVRKVGDTYELVLEGDWYASSEGDKVVVKLGGPIPPPVVIFWKLIRVGEVSYVLVLIPLSQSYSIANKQFQIRQDQIHR